MTKLVIIGGSSGGLRAVEAILSRLPADYDVPVLVVLHQADDAPGHLPGLLDGAGPLSAHEAVDKIALEGGRVYVAPPGYHVLVEDGHLALSVDARVRFSRPSIDVAMETAAHELGPDLVGVVLTGANDDGAAGLARVRRRGGVAVVQDPATSEAATMPAAACAAADPHVVADVGAIATFVAGLSR